MSGRGKEACLPLSLDRIGRERERERWSNRSFRGSGHADANIYTSD